MSQSPTRSESNETEHHGLPMLVPEHSELHEGWLTRVMRILFGWKAAATRADLELVLTAEQPESGFSPAEATMLKNILGLRECRIESVMVPISLRYSSTSRSANSSWFSPAPAIRGS